MSIQFARPRIVISRCLEHDACRYNGAMIRDDFIAKLKRHVDFHTICPEVAIGMGVPRKPIRIVLRDERRELYQPATGELFTEAMREYTESELDSVAAEGVDGFLLKHRSPSCGPWDVKAYYGFENPGPAPKTRGFFGGQVVERFGDMPVEDEGRLHNFALREHFLTAVFALAALREIRAQARMRDLVAYHSRNKLILLAYDQTALRRLGQIVANHEHLDTEEVFARYSTELKHCLAKPVRFAAMINSLQHAFGGVSACLSPRERAFFHESLEEYRDERIPLSAVLKMLQSWALHHERAYLLEQTLFRPYPLELVEITDSGKGRKLR